MRPRMNFSPPSIPSPSFRESRPEAKRTLDSNVMVAKGTSSNDVWSSASVTRKATRTLASSRRGPNARRDFLEKDDIRKFRSLEDMAEDEFGT